MPPKNNNRTKKDSKGTAKQATQSSAPATNVAKKSPVSQPDPTLTASQKQTEEIKDDTTSNNAASEMSNGSPVKSGAQSQRQNASSPNEKVNSKQKSPGTLEKIRLGNVAEGKTTQSPESKSNQGFIKAKKDIQAVDIDEPNEEESLIQKDLIIKPSPCETKANDSDVLSMNEANKISNKEVESMPSSSMDDQDVHQSIKALQSNEDNNGGINKSENDKNEEQKVSQNEFSSLSAKETRSYERNQEDDVKSIPNKIAIVRKPSPKLTEGIVTHIAKQSVEFAKALKQWNSYVKVLLDNGWNIIEAPPADDCPDGVFIEDVIVMYRGTALMTNPGSDVRKKELVGIEEFLINILGCTIKKIVEPGTLDGGDILKVGNTIFVGQSKRTNEEGIRQLAEIFEPQGAKIVPIPLTKVLHLKSAVTALPNGTIIGWDQAVDDQKAFGLPYLSAKEESGAHVVILDENRLMISEFASQSMKFYREQIPGIKFGTINISEFEKLEGCVTCLSVRVRELPENSRFFQLFPQKPSSTRKSSSGKEIIVPGNHYKFEDLLKFYVSTKPTTKESEKLDLIQSQPQNQDPQQKSTVQESTNEEESKDSPNEVPSQSNKILPQTLPQTDAMIENEEEVKQADETQSDPKEASEEIDQSAKQESSLQEVEENKDAPQEDQNIIQNQAESNFGGNSNQEQQSTITTDSQPKAQLQEDQPLKETMDHPSQPNSSLEASKEKQPDPSLAQAEFIEEHKENSDALKSPQKKLELNTSDLEMKMQTATSLEGSLLQNFEGGKGSTDPLKSEDRNQVSSEVQQQEDEVVHQEDEHPQKPITDANIENDEENKEDGQNQEASSDRNGQSELIKTDIESNGAKDSQVDAHWNVGERDNEDINGQGEDSNQDAKIDQQSEIQVLPQQNQNQNNMEAESAENPQHQEQPAAGASDNLRMPYTTEPSHQAQNNRNLDGQIEEEKEKALEVEADQKTEVTKEAHQQEEEEEKKEEEVQSQKPKEEQSDPKDSEEKPDDTVVSDNASVKPDEQVLPDGSGNQEQSHDAVSQSQPEAENHSIIKVQEVERSSLEEQPFEEVKENPNPHTSTIEKTNEETHQIKAQSSSLPQQEKLPTASMATNGSSNEEENKEELQRKTNNEQQEFSSPAKETPEAVDPPVGPSPKKPISIMQGTPHSGKIEHSHDHDHEGSIDDEVKPSSEAPKAVNLEDENFEKKYLESNEEQKSVSETQNESNAPQLPNQVEPPAIKNSQVKPLIDKTVVSQIKSEHQQETTQEGQQKNEGVAKNLKDDDDYGNETRITQKRKPQSTVVENNDKPEEKFKETDAQTDAVMPIIVLPDLGPELNDVQLDLLHKLNIQQVSEEFKPNQQVSLFLTKINEQMEMNQQLASEIDRLNGQVQESEAQLQEFHAQVQAQNEILSQKKATISVKFQKVRAEHEELKKESEKCKVELHENLQSAFVDLSHKVTYTAHKQVTNAKINLLKAKKERSDLLLQKLKFVSQKIADFKKYKEESKDQLEKMFTQTKQEMVQEFNLKTTIFQKFDLRHVQQVKQIKELTSSRNQLQTQLSSTSQALEKQKIDNTQLSKQLTDRKKQFEEKCQAYDQLHREYEAYKRDHLAEKENLLSQRTRVEAKERDTQNRLQLLQADSYRLSLEKSDFDQLKMRQDQLLQSEEKKVREREKDILRRSMELDIRGRSQNTEIDQLRQKLARSQQETQAARRELDTIQQQYQHLNSQIAGFQSKLGNMSMEKSTAESQYKQMKFYFQVLFYAIAFLTLSQIFFNSRK